MWKGVHKYILSGPGHEKVTKMTVGRLEMDQN